VSVSHDVEAPSLARVIGFDFVVEAAAAVAVSRRFIVLAEAVGFEARWNCAVKVSRNKRP
jgi:hypothetical protein